MFLDPYYTVSDGWLRISATQASRFAREVAGDYNPIHNPGARRFCVPGDLLFALVLTHCGLSRQMRFAFRGMVGDDLPLRIAEPDAGSIQMVDRDGRVVLDVERSGAVTREPSLVEAIALRYVAFSAQNFAVLQPLMAKHRVMFNPDRPMVIYQGMGLDLRHLAVAEPVLTLSGSSLSVNGRRGQALLRFAMHAGTDSARPAGHGWKALLLSGLREYDDQRVRALMREFERLRLADAMR